MPRPSPVPSRLLAGILTVLNIGCVELGAAASEAAGSLYKGQPRDRLELRCDAVDAAARDVTRPAPGWVPMRRAYEGTVRERQEIAVVAVQRKWSELAGDNWTLYATAVDDQPMVREMDPGGGEERLVEVRRECDPSMPCEFLAILPGSHTINLLAVSGGEKAVSSRLEGQVRFEATAGGLYALLACSGVFWVRDEESGVCVSTSCPGL